MKWRYEEMERTKVLNKFYQKGTEGFQVLGQIGDKYIVQWGLNEGATWDDIWEGYSYESYDTLEEATRDFQERFRLYGDVT
jgi:hypothetical protein